MAKKESLSNETIYGGVIVVLLVLLVISVFTQGFGLVKTTQPTTTPSNLASLTVTTGNYPALGQASAPVTIVEFSDFQCPYCGQLYSNAEQSIRTNYVDTGKAQLYFRDFPLTQIHQDAMSGAVASACANDQGKFWAMHDTLFTNQGTWSTMSNDTSTIEGYAATIGLNTATFDNCFETQQHVSEINADEQAGVSYGVQGTPGIFVIIPKGDVNISSLQSAVTSIGNGATIFQDSNDYTVFFPGAFAYSDFESVLSK